MAVEIGSLVVKGSFGTSQNDSGQSRTDRDAEFAILRREILREVREIMQDNARRAREE